MKRKKRISLILACTAICCMGVFAGCGKGRNTTASGTYSIVCTIFPEYDWTREVLGARADDFNLTLLMDSGVDLHSYQPTADDIAKIADCDLFVYVGGESDVWVKDALAESSNADLKVINLMETLGDAVREEEIIKGMEQVEEEEEGDSAEYDEHVWLSLDNAKVLVTAIADDIKAIDPDNGETYEKNTQAYLEQLDALDAKYKGALAATENRLIIFGDRFPFRYLAEDYGLEYYAAFMGCSAETEASFETVTFLAGKLDEFGLSQIVVTESSDGKLAETIINASRNANREILTMNSMQSVTAKDIKEGVTYLSMMEDNFQILKQALN